MNKTIRTILPLLLASAGGLPAMARAGTVRIEGDHEVTGSQTIQSNQTVAGALTVHGSNAAAGAALDVRGSAAQLAGARLRALGLAGSERWVRVARIGDSSNALFSGRLLAEGGGADYVADFAFPAAPASGPYAALLVEMGAATNFAWEVRSDGGSNYLWFMQPAGSRFANFLYAQEGCAEAWSTNGPPSGDLVWSGADGQRGVVRAGGMSLGGGGLALADGTVLSSGTNITAARIADGTNVLLSAANGTLSVSGPAEFHGAVSLPETIALGPDGVSLSAQRWDMVDSTFRPGSGWEQRLAASGASEIRGMAGDPSGNKYVYGTFCGTMSLQGGIAINSATVSATGSGENDRAAFLVKFNPTGVVAWAKAFSAYNHTANGTNNEKLCEIADAVADGSGNVYLGGAFRGTVNFAGQSKTAVGGGDGFIASLNASGGYRWFRQFGGSNAADAVADVDVDAAGAWVGAGGTLWSLGDDWEDQGWYDENMLWNENWQVVGQVWNSDGFAARLTGSGGVITQQWALAGSPAAPGPEPEHVDPKSSAVSHACLSSNGVVARWTGDGESLLKLGGTEWSQPCPVNFSRMMSIGTGDVLVAVSEWTDGEANDLPSGVTRLSVSAGEPVWSRYGEYSRTSEAPRKTLRDLALVGGNLALGWWQRSDAEAPGRVLIESLNASGTVLSSNAFAGDGSDMARVFLEGGTNIHAFGSFSGELDLGPAGTLAGGGLFHAQVPFAGTDATSAFKIGGGSGELRGMAAAGPILALAYQASPPSVIHDDGRATSVALDGILAVDRGIRLADGTVIASAADILALDPWRAATAAGSYWLNGNVGLGTDSPQARLHVVGNARVTGGATIDGGATIGGSAAVSGSATVGGTATINGAATIGGGLGMGGNLSVGGGAIALGTNGTTIDEAGWNELNSRFLAPGDRLVLRASGAATVAGLVTGASGDRYAYGAFSGTMDFGGGRVLSSGTSEGDLAGFVLKLNPLGPLVWARALPAVGHAANGTTGETLVAIARAAVDGAGNLVLGGGFRGTVDFVGLTNAAQGGGDGFLLSLSPEGKGRWLSRFGGGSAEPEAIADIKIGPGGNDVLAGGSLIGSNNLDGLVVRVAASDGAESNRWQLAGDPGDALEPNAADVPSGVSHACFAGTGAAAVWRSDGGTGCVVRLDPASGPLWEYWVIGAGRELLLDGAGGIVLSEDGDGYGRVCRLDASTGQESWAPLLGHSFSDGGYYSFVDNFGSVAMAPDGRLWVPRDWQEQGVVWDEGSQQYVGTSDGGTEILTGASGVLPAHFWHKVGMAPSRLRVDGNGNLNAIASFSGPVDLGAVGTLSGTGTCQIGFDGTNATVAAAQVVTLSGSLVDFAASPEALTLACAGPPPSVGTFGPWINSVAVDGYLSVASGVRLGDGTLLGSAGDLVALGPVQFGSGGAAYYSGGDFGIGTAAPTARLDVDGDASIRGPLILGGDLTVVGSLMGSAGQALGVAASLSVSGDITATGVYRAGTNSVQLTTAAGSIRPEALERRALGDLPMGAFTNGPAQ